MVSYPAKIINSIRKDGLYTTFVLIKIRFDSFFELIFPGHYYKGRIGIRSIQSKLTKEEIDRLYKWNEYLEILMWSGGPLTELSLNGFKQQLDRQRRLPQINQRVFYIVLRSGEIIGKIGLYKINWQNFEGEMGVYLDPKYWGQQYGREALDLLIQYTFRKTPLKRIYLGTFAENIRAQKSFSACGFRYVKNEKRYNPIMRKIFDGVEMEITLSDYLNRLKTYDSKINK